MKRIGLIASLAGLGLFLTAPSFLAAQDGPPPPQPQQVGAPPAAESNHVEVGVFGDYLRFAPSTSNVNFVGAGARVGVNLSRHAAIEAEMSYDFARNYTSTSTTNNSGTITTTFVTTHLRPLTGLFGPTMYLGSPSAHLFVTGKVGFIDFSTSNPNNVSGQGFSNAVSGIGGAGTHFAAYPGGGLEGFFGPFGLRAEVGDEFYLAGGAHGNLRATFGPEIRF